MSTSSIAAIVATLLALTAGIADKAAPKTVDLAFWAGSKAEKDSRVVEIYEHHACSARVAVARVHVMPHPSDDDALGPEVVVEFSVDGHVTQRWAIPIDSIVAAVTADRLIIPRGEARVGAPALSIATSGEFEQTTVPEGVDYGTPVSCPKLEEYGDSGYLRCWQFRDLRSKEVRRLAYQGPCT